MDLKSVKNKAADLFGKYKYVALILLIGIALMLLPSTSKKNTEIKTTATVNKTLDKNIDDDLEEILSKISGAGKVEVLLTVSKGEETVYQTNENISESSDSVNSNIDTVIITDSNRNEQGIVTRIDPAEYLGAVVLCQGADSPSVRLAIIEAVSKITGLGADSICVLKMK